MSNLPGESWLTVHESPTLEAQSVWVCCSPAERTHCKRKRIHCKWGGDGERHYFLEANVLFSLPPKTYHNMACRGSNDASLFFFRQKERYTHTYTYTVTNRLLSGMKASGLHQTLKVQVKHASTGQAFDSKSWIKHQTTFTHTFSESLKSIIPLPSPLYHISLNATLLIYWQDFAVGRLNNEINLW